MTLRHHVAAFTTVAAPIEHVWRLLSDTRRYEEWVESTIRVVHADGETRLGMIYQEQTRLSGFWTALTTWEVVEFEPLTHLAFQCARAGAARDLRIEFTAAPAGASTELSSTYSYGLRFGVLGSLIEFVAKNNVTAEQRRTLRTFAILAEHEMGGRDR